MVEVFTSIKAIFADEYDRLYNQIEVVFADGYNSFSLVSNFDFFMKTCIQEGQKLEENHIIKFKTEK